MKCFCIVIIGFSLFGLSSANVIPSQMKFEPDVISETSSRNDTLVFAHVIFRHGKRNTGGVYPNDPHTEDDFPGGFGQLINEGKRQMFSLGQYLHQRYSQILNEKYSPNEIYVQSTDFDRTIMSAQAILAGLYPPKNEQIWNENIMWQPIPVHSVPIKSDIVICGKPCFKSKALYLKYLAESAEMLEIHQKFGHMFPYWTEKSGMNITSPLHIFMMYDILRSEKEHNITLPDWADDALKPMKIIAVAVYKSVTGTTELARLTGGFLLKEMLERFSQKISSTLKPDRSVWLYSAHDLVIVNQLNILGLYDELHIPPCASSLHFELYKNAANVYYIQIYYKQPDENYMIPLNIPRCGEKCPFEQFATLYESMIPGDFDTECSSSSRVDSIQSSVISPIENEIVHVTSSKR